MEREEEMDGNIIPFRPKSQTRVSNKHCEENRDQYLTKLSEMQSLLQQTLIGIDKTRKAIRSGDVQQMIKVRNMVRERLKYTKDKS